jgi:hypothetical protein
MTGAGPPDDAIREAARAVLARPEYARFRFAETIPDWVEALKRWIAEYAQWTRALADTSPVLFALFIGTLVLISALLLAHIVWSLRVAMRGRPGESGPSGGSAARRDFAEEAARLAARGDVLEACRALQLACLDLLIGRGALALARHDSNSTLRQRLRGSALPASLRDELIAAVDRLERSWFRDREPSVDLLALWQRVHAGLARAVA